MSIDTVLRMFNCQSLSDLGCFGSIMGPIIFIPVWLGICSSFYRIPRPVKLVVLALLVTWLLLGRTYPQTSGMVSYVVIVLGSYSFVAMLLMLIYTWVQMFCETWRS